MTSVHNLDARGRASIVNRLKRIEGQSRGIQRMVDDGRDCQEIITQLAAMKAATHSLSAELLEQFALHCLQNRDESEPTERMVAKLVGVVSQLTR